MKFSTPSPAHSLSIAGLLAAMLYGLDQEISLAEWLRVAIVVGVSVALWPWLGYRSGAVALGSLLGYKLLHAIDAWTDGQRVAVLKRR